AGESAAVLGREAKGVTARSGHVDRFDQTAVREGIGHLAGLSVRGLPTSPFREGSERELLLEPRPEWKRQVGHLGKRRDAMEIHPVRDLTAAEGLLSQGEHHPLQLRA